jgi:hypothetical protein
MADGKIRIKKSASTTDNLVNDRGLSLPQVNFADSFIFSEIGNEEAFQFDYDDEEWYLDLSKILPASTSIINIEAPQAGDTIIYDPIEGKFINNSVFIDELTIVKDKVSDADSHISTIEQDIDDIKKIIGATSEIVDYSAELAALRQQIENLSNLINSQQTTITSQQSKLQSITSTGTPSFRYQMVDKEIPAGHINGNNKTFNLTKVPVPGSESVFLNGVMQDYGRDYTLNDKHITFTEAPLDGMVIRCNYRVTDDPDVTKATKNPILYNADYGSNPAYIYALIEKEIPTGTINGTNKIFNLANTPIEGSVSVYLNGVLQEEGGSRANYTINEGVITFIEAPLPGMVIRTTYKIY